MSLFKLVVGENYEFEVLGPKQFVTGKIREYYWDKERLGLIVENLETGFDEYFLSAHLLGVRYVPHIRISMFQAKKDLKKAQAWLTTLHDQCEHEIVDPFIEGNMICRDCGTVRIGVKRQSN